MSNQVVLGPVRFSYLNVLEKTESLSGDMQYSAVIMIPKKEKSIIDKANAAIKDAIDFAVRKGKIKKGDIKQLYVPLRDGDDHDDRGSKSSEFDGMIWMNVNNKHNQPSVVDSSREPILNDEEIYSGMWGYAHITFSVYNTRGKKGVGAYINHIMKTMDDDRLDGRVSAEEAFGEIEPELE